MKRIIIRGIIILMVVSSSTLAHAQSTFYPNIDALGMGNTSNAIRRGVGGMFYNPALLSRVKFDLSIVNLNIQWNENADSVRIDR